jgi:hypothetical protein
MRREPGCKKEACGKNASRLTLRLASPRRTVEVSHIDRVVRAPRWQDRTTPHGLVHHLQMPCVHGKRTPSVCKELTCSGCEDGRVRSKCKECGGSGLCEHGRVSLRSTCKECGGSGICEHGRIRRAPSVPVVSHERNPENAADSRKRG